MRTQENVCIWLKNFAEILTNWEENLSVTIALSSKPRELKIENITHYSNAFKEGSITQGEYHIYLCIDF